MTDINTTAPVTTAKIDPVKLVAKLTAERSKLEARLAEIATELEPLAAIAEAAAAAAKAREVIDVTGLDAYTKVDFVFGRKDNRKTISGSVVAFAPAEDKTPARYKIEVGSGFNTNLYVVPARDVSLSAGDVLASE